MANKQVVFVVNTDKDGNAEYDAKCALRGCLDGKIKSIQYIPDNRLPYDSGVSFSFSGATSGEEVLKVSDVTERTEWNPDASLANEPIKVVIENGGKGRSGSFVVTTE